MTWEACQGTQGDWFWYALLPNGCTAWVIDDSIRRKVSTQYRIAVTSSVGSTSVGGRTFHSHRAFESFRKAKISAIGLALQAPRFLDRTYLISVERKSQDKP